MDKYCSQEIYDKKTKTYKKCKEKTNSTYCKTHQMIIDDGFGICCFCGEGCNPMSQSCGICARKLFFYL